MSVNISELFTGTSESDANSCQKQQQNVNGRADKKARTDAPQRLADSFSQYDESTPPPPEIVRFALDVTDQDTATDWYKNDFNVPIYDWTSYVYIATLGTDTRRSTYGQYTTRVLTLTERYVLSYIYLHAVVKNEKVVKVNQQYLADNLNMSHTQINNIIRVLTDANLIIKLPTVNGSRGINCMIANIKITSSENSDLSTRIDRSDNTDNTTENSDLSTRIDSNLSTRIDSTNTTNTKNSVCADAHRAPTAEIESKQTGSERKRKPTQSERRMYGEFDNIPFTDAEYQKALDQYGEQLLTEKINQMSAYYANDPKKPHNNGLALMRTWTRKDREFSSKQLPKAPEPQASTDLSDVDEK